jgi:hypothetical protein
VKLTEAQMRALNWFADGHYRNAYRARSSIGTLEALYRRGFLSKRSGQGAFFAPRTAIDWAITSAGRAALKERGE